MSDNEKRLKAASDLVRTFEKEKDPERLREASMELENVDLRRVYDRTARHKLRTDCLELWLKIVQILDKNLDPKFDPDQVPSMSVMPPRTKSGVQFPPGADPTLIDDSNEREDYQKAIAENRSNQQSYLFQTELRELDDVIPGKVDHFLSTAYTAADSDEARMTIDRLIESEARRRSLHRPIDLHNE